MTYDSSIPLLAQLHQAAAVETDHLVKYNLNLCKNELWTAFRKFEERPSGDNLVELNGAWAHGVRVLNFATDPAPNGRPGAGLKAGAELAWAA